ncbi:MAG: hypothetical protein ACI8ZM_001697 [Crocinitomix sp.]|jgi:hypothetical protein
MIQNGLTAGTYALVRKEIYITKIKASTLEMSKQVIFLLFFLTSLSYSSFGQSGVHQTLNSQKADSLLRIEFNDYLNFIINQPNDSILEIDSSKVYKINFVTTCSFNGWINDTSYIDSSQLICIKEIQKRADSLKLNFIDFKVVKSGNLKLNDSSNLDYFTYEKNTKAYQPSNADYSSFISFTNGQYMIISERRFGPDNRGSMPPGYDITYFIELIR